MELGVALRGVDREVSTPRVDQRVAPELTARNLQIGSSPDKVRGLAAEREIATHDVDRARAQASGHAANRADRGRIDIDSRRKDDSLIGRLGAIGDGKVHRAASEKHRQRLAFRHRDGIDGMLHAGAIGDHQRRSAMRQRIRDVGADRYADVEQIFAEGDARLLGGDIGDAAPRCYRSRLFHPRRDHAEIIARLEIVRFDPDRFACHARLEWLEAGEGILIVGEARIGGRQDKPADIEMRRCANKDTIGAVEPDITETCLTIYMAGNRAVELDRAPGRIDPVEDGEVARAREIDSRRGREKIGVPGPGIGGPVDHRRRGRDRDRIEIAVARDAVARAGQRVGGTGKAELLRRRARDRHRQHRCQRDHRT